jgi:hypothetical protein
MIGEIEDDCVFTVAASTDHCRADDNVDLGPPA